MAHTQSNIWLDQDELKDLSEKVLAKLADDGTEADLILDYKQSLSLKANQGQLEEQKITQLQQLGLRIVKDKKVGMAYTEATDADALDHLVSQALINAQYASEEPNEQVVNLSDLKQSGQANTDDELLCPTEAVSLEEKIDFILDLEGRLLASEKIKAVPYNGLSENHRQRVICSTKGTLAQTRERSYSAYAYALAEAGEENAMAGQYSVDRKFHGLDSNTLSQEAARESLAMLDGKPISSGHYSVIFSTECFAQILSVFMLAMSGKAAKDQLSPWREKLGHPVTDSRLTLLDQPLNPAGLGFTLFDDEGVLAGDTALVKEGNFCTFLHNSMTANYFGVTTTGHAARGPKSALSVSSHQLAMLPGESNQKALYQGTILEVTDLSGLHSGANAITGDFSFGASGYLKENGETSQVVRGVTVAGNFYDMLLKQVGEIGDEAIWDWSKSAYMPKVSFLDMPISGA